MQRKHIQCSMEIFQMEQSSREHKHSMLDERKAVHQLIKIKYGTDEATSKIAMLDAI